MFINSLENCQDKPLCKSNQYRGKDCKCYCKNDEKDAEIPAVKCSAGKLTLEEFKIFI